MSNSKKGEKKKNNKNCMECMHGRFYAIGSLDLPTNIIFNIYRIAKSF